MWWLVGSSSARLVHSTYCSGVAEILVAAGLHQRAVMVVQRGKKVQAVGFVARGCPACVALLCAASGYVALLACGHRGLQLRIASVGPTQRLIS